MNSLKMNKIPKRIIKFLFISDTHFGVHFAIRPRNKLKFQYGSRFFQTVEQNFRHAIEQEEVDFILHGGDFFNRSKPPPDVIKRATSSLLWAAKYVQIYLIPGNHERSKLPLGLLEYHENIHVFSKPCSYIFEKDDIRIKISGFPYIRHKARNKFKSVINSALQNEIDRNSYHSQYNILLMHQLIQGSMVEHYTFNKGHNVIKSSDIPPIIDLVATGHVHRYQILYSTNNGSISTHTQREVIHDLTSQKWHFVAPTANKKNLHPAPVICYSGACERVSMMERNEQKGYVLGKITSHNSDRIQPTEVHLEFIPTLSTNMKYIKWNVLNKSIEELEQEVQILIQDMNRKISNSSLAGLIHISVHESESITSSRFTRLIDQAKKNNVLLTVRWKSIS